MIVTNRGQKLQKIQIFRHQWAFQAKFSKDGICNICETVRQSTENFTQNFLSYGTLHGWSGVLKVTIHIIQYGGGRHIEKIKIAITVCRPMYTVSTKKL